MLAYLHWYNPKRISGKFLNTVLIVNAANTRSRLIQIVRCEFNVRVILFDPEQKVSMRAEPRLQPDLYNEIDNFRKTKQRDGPPSYVTICYPAINDIAVSVHLTSAGHPAQQVYQIQH